MVGDGAAELTVDRPSTGPYAENMSPEWVKLTSASDAYEAEVMTGRLEVSGIGSRTSKGSDAPGAWLTGNENSFGPIDIHVSRGQLAAAQQALELTDHPDEADAPPPRSAIKIVAAVLVVSLIAAVLVSALTDALR